jgi:glycosyltransferase involved in cell wall biosynthesis
VNAGSEGTLVSVVIPTFNRPAEVDAAVASVLIQDVPCEVLVVDDGSNPQILPVGSLADPSVRILRSAESTGPTLARSRGIEAASGRYIAFLDDDDIWLPGKLRRCLEVAAEHPEVRVVVHRTGLDVRMASKGAGNVRVEDQPLFLYGRNATPHLDSVLVDAELAKAVGFDENFYACQDIDFVLGLARQTPFAILDEVLALRGKDSPPSAIGIERRITGRNLLNVKHRDVFDSDPEARAFHLVRTAHLHRRGGDRARAIKDFFRALKHRPLYIPAWRGLVTTMLPSSVAANLSMQLRIMAEERR